MAIFKTTSLPKLKARRDSLAADLQAAQAAAEAARAKSVEAALAGGDLDAADAAIHKHEQRVSTLSSALAQIDAQIAAAEAAALAAERKKLRDEAAAKVHEWRADANALRAKILPLIREVRGLAVRHDNVGAGFANHMISPLVGQANAALFIGAEAPKTFDVLLRRLESDDPEAASLANRILNFQMPAMAPLE